MTNTEPAAAAAAAVAALEKWREHVRRCAGCRPAGPMCTCAPGLRLWRDRWDRARAAEIPGQEGTS
jgi:hypothetical protein